MSYTRSFAVIFFSSIFWINSSALAAPDGYIATTLESLGVPGRPLKINNSGQILSQSVDGHGYLYNPGSGVLSIPTPEQPLNPQLYYKVTLTDLNNDGVVTGDVEYHSGNFLVYKKAFIFAEINGLNYLSEFLGVPKEIHKANTLNDFGDLFGSEIITQTMQGIEEELPFLFNDTLGFVPFDPSNIFLSVNNRREAVGEDNLGGYTFLYTPADGIIPITTAGNIADFHGREINDSAQIVGYSTVVNEFHLSSAAAYTPDQGVFLLPTLSGLPDYGRAISINDDGLIIATGWIPQSGQTPNYDHVGTLIAGDEIWDLNTLVTNLDPVLYPKIVRPVDINSAGEIVVFAEPAGTGDGQYLLLTPTDTGQPAIDFDGISSGNYNPLLVDGYSFSPRWNTRVSIVTDVGNQTLSPAWGDTMVINREDNAVFNFNSFDFKGRWSGVSGTVTITAIRADQTHLTATIHYDDNTTWNAFTPDWTELEAVYMTVTDGTVLLDQLSLSQPDSTIINFENASTGKVGSLVTDGFTFSPTWNTVIDVADYAGNQAIAPLWGDKLVMKKSDDSSFILNQFNYRGRWPGVSGDVEVIGHKSNGSRTTRILSFKYEPDRTRWETQLINWNDLIAVEFKTTDSALLLDNIVLN